MKNEVANFPRFIVMESLEEVCNILTFDPAQKCYSKVMHWKEVTHSNGQ